MSNHPINIPEPTSSNDCAQPGPWRLRRARNSDSEALFDLLSLPPVFEFLCDGVPPPYSKVEEVVSQPPEAMGDSGYGFWLLFANDESLVGGVGLKPYARPDVAELTYLLHPTFWGKGLATRMSWTVIEWGFQTSLFNQVVAGADAPNKGSIAVMKRLGMRYFKDVTYPLGPGVEYALRANDPKPSPLPIAIRFSD